MYTKVLTFLALITIVRSHDVIVGLKTDGTKFFDENRQANPALWRQMDNVTIKAPENEVIRRIVITDLRPDKDGDAKIVEGGEGHKNVTIELKSPTVLRGYEFHIEAYAAPDDQSPLGNDQRTTENTLGDATKTTAQETNLGTTSKIPELPTVKGVPAVVSQDEVNKDSSEREGRSAKTEDNITTEATTELTSTVKGDISTTPATQLTENTEKSVTEKSSEKSGINENDQKSPVPPIPLNRNYNPNPQFPAVTITEITNTKEHNAQDKLRNVRDTEAKQTEKPTEEKKDDPTPSSDLFKSATDESKEITTTETSEVKPTEEKSEEKDREHHLNAPKVHTFQNRKYTSFIPSTVPNGPGPITLKDDEKPRNARDVNEEQRTTESLSTTTESGETTANVKDVEATTNDECVTLTPDNESDEETNVKNPVSVAKENQGTPDRVPLYVNTRQWDQRFNNPNMQSDDFNDKKSQDDAKVFPLPLDQPEKDSETLGNGYKNSPDHMENRNPKFSGITSFTGKNTPVISTQ